MEVFLVALRLGLTSFGGPVAHIGIFRDEYVRRRAWLDEAAFAELVALTALLPGPSSSQLGIAIGTVRAGRLGGLAAWLGFTLPSAVALTAFALLVGPAEVVAAGWAHGLGLAAAAVVLSAVISMARTLARGLPRLAIAAGSAAIALLAPGPVGQTLTIAVAAAVGGVLFRGDVLALGFGLRFPFSRRFATGALATFAALLGGLPLLRGLVDWQALQLVWAFFRAGSLVFGGGHVVLPLLQESTVATGWVGEQAFLAGYGAAQAVPGPLFSFAAYLGAAGEPEPNGVAGAAIALGSIFLPSFLLIFGALPFWDQLRTSAGFRRALSGTNAAVVGILLAALITPVWTSAVAGPLDVAIAALGLALLLTGRVPPIAVVALSALLGQLVAL